MTHTRTSIMSRIDRAARSRVFIACLVLAGASAPVSAETTVPPPFEVNEHVEVKLIDDSDLEITLPAGLEDGQSESGRQKLLEQAYPLIRHFSDSRQPVQDEHALSALSLPNYDPLPIKDPGLPLAGAKGVSECAGAATACGFAVAWRALACAAVVAATAEDGGTTAPLIPEGCGAAWAGAGAACSGAAAECAGYIESWFSHRRTTVHTQPNFVAHTTPVTAKCGSFHLAEHLKYYYNSSQVVRLEMGCTDGNVKVITTTTTPSNNRKYWCDAGRLIGGVRVRVNSSGKILAMGAICQDYTGTPEYSYSTMGGSTSGTLYEVKCKAGHNLAEISADRPTGAYLEHLKLTCH